MKLGTVAAGSGEKTFGFFQTGVTHGRFPVHIPLHIINGAQPGPRLVVQAGASGLEIEPSLVLPHIAQELDPAQISGTVIIVPLMNTSGFEFEQVNSAWDDKHLNRLGRGCADGSVSEQMIHAWYADAIAGADALLDIRTGSQWSYHHYAGCWAAGNADKSRALAVSLGLSQVLGNMPADDSMAAAAAEDGIASVAAYVGGGPGLRDYREDDMERIRNAILNSMKHLGMLDGELVRESDEIAVIEAHTTLMPTGERGFTFIDSSKRGQLLAAGEEIGYVRHPFTGEVLERITAPRAGVMLHAGLSWPVPPEDTVLAILGDQVASA